MLAQFLDKVVLPFVVQDRRLSRQCRYLCSSARVLGYGRLHPVVAQRQFPWAQAFQQTIEILLLQYIDKVGRLFVQVQQVPRVQA